MIKTLYEIKLNAAKPCMPLDPWMAFKNSSSSLRIVDLPKKIGTWEITGVYVEVTYPDGQIVSKSAVKNGSVYVVTIDGTEAVGKVLNGYRVCASGRDENGETVERYILGVGDVYIKDLDGTITPGTTADTMRIYQAKPEDPKKGDAVFEDGKLEVFDGQNWVSTGSGVIESETNKGWAQNSDFANESNWAVDAGAVDWENVENKPTIPTKTSQLENDSHYIDGLQDDKGSWEINVTNADWADTAPWNGITGKPDIPSRGDIQNLNQDVQNLNDWCYNLDSQLNDVGYRVGEIENDYATKAEIPTVNDSTITIKQGGETKGTFALNQATPKTIELDAGGGSAGDCILEAYQYAAYMEQNATWTNKEGKQCKVCPTYDDRLMHLYIDGVARIYTYNISVPVNGNISINWDGYSSDCTLILDGCYTNSRPTVIDSSLYKHIIINFASCLEENTLITMADGSTKAVKDIEVGDMVLSLNPDTMELEPDEATLGYCGMPTRSGDTVDEWTFDDGTVIKTVHPHQFFNVRTGKMEYIADFQIGDKVRKQDGTETALVKHELILKRTKHATLFTRKFNNYFANGVLTGNRKSVKWGWYWIEQHEENSNED